MESDNNTEDILAEDIQVCTSLDESLTLEIEPNENEISDYIDDEDRLIIATPTKKKRKLEPEDPIIKELNELLDQQLEEKAAKSNLKTNHVKHILKHVVTDEVLLEYITHVSEEKPADEMPLKYEPKLTRAKAKEIYSKPIPPPWKSELKPTPLPTQAALFEANLSEDDSSGDEYVPDEEELVTNNESAHSSVDKISNPPTPTSADCSTQTNWSEDGCFKIPESAEAKINENANIALRTRSKLQLSDTDLDEIIEQFIPPDDLDADVEYDDDWLNFLQEFTKPIEEVVKCQEDEEHDPEYNVMADENVNTFDREELRADPEVNITREELNELIAELVDYADNFNNYFPQLSNKGCINEKHSDVIIENNNVQQADVSEAEEPISEARISESEKTSSSECVPIEKEKEKSTNLNYANIVKMACDNSEDEVEVVEQFNIENLVHPNECIVISDDEDSVLQEDHKLLFEQQVRQYIQLLTQSFLLSHGNEEHEDIAITCEQCLGGLDEALRNKQCYDNCNIREALSVFVGWKTMMNSDRSRVRSYKEYVQNSIEEAGLRTTTLPKFHSLVAEVILKSSVFMYPLLLPAIPYTARSNSKVMGFTKSEDELIAIGIEQIVSFLNANKIKWKRNRQPNLQVIAHYIQKYVLMPRTASTIYTHICAKRKEVDLNPIKYYFLYDKPPKTFHHMLPLDVFLKQPPYKRKPNELPGRWRGYLYRLYRRCHGTTAITEKPIELNEILPSAATITKVSKPPPYNKKFSRKPGSSKASSHKQSFVNETLASSTPISKKTLFKFCTPPEKTIQISETLLEVKFNSSVLKKISKSPKMLPSMPTLENEGVFELKYNDEESEEMSSNPNTVTEVTDTAADVIDDKEEKDNIDDINALLVASSTIKSATASKRRPSGVEKKRAKLKRDFEETMRLLVDEDKDVLTEKRNRFIQAFYDKVQETLELEDFHKFMAALNDFDEANSSATLLYNEVDSIIGKKHPDIMNEFLLFFDALQAKQIGKLVPYLMMSNMSLFLRKLEIYFQDQPSQVRKIYRTLTELSQNEDVTMAQIKSTVLPLLKGNSLLIDWFLQIFPMEKPPMRLLTNGAWENVCLNKEKDLFENIVLPEVDDPYGGPNCNCTCHAVEETAFKMRTKHCTPCGTKFMQGRVFIQTGKGLRPVKITFSDTSVNHTARLCGTPKLKRPSESSPTKLISPGKDSQDETRQSSDDDTDKKHRKLMRDPKIRVSKKKILAEEGLAQTSIELASSQLLSSTEEIATACSSTDDCAYAEPSTSKAAEDNEVEISSVEGGEVRLSPDLFPSGAESESEELETSQDNNSDSDVSTTEPNPTSEWTREEDKVILQTFQQEEDMDIAFDRILQALSGRTMGQIKSRFDILMKFLKNMSSDT